MGKQNCWEFKDCGRGPGGSKVHEMGICPAAELEDADGFLEGKNGGRACAYITGTFCSGIIQGTHMEKEKACGECEFYKNLRKEHGFSALSVLNFSKYIKSRNAGV